MSIKLILEILLFALILIFVIIQITRKGRMPIKYALIWFFSAFIILLVALIPNLMSLISNLLGFETMSNMIVAILIGILIFITMLLTIIVSGQKKKITLLIQEISLLKEKINNK